MNIKIKRWLLDRLDAIENNLSIIHTAIREKFDSCEVCHQYNSDTACVGCNRRICWECDSSYYYDEVLCKECRKQITPEEE